MFTVAFDVDDCLIRQDSHGTDGPNYSVINLLMQFHALGARIVVWSGGGIDYAERWVDKLSLATYVDVIEKGSRMVDLAVDDEQVNMGWANFQVPR